MFHNFGIMPNKPTMRITDITILKKVIKAVETQFKKGFERIPPEMPKKIRGFYLENNGHKTFLMYQNHDKEVYIITPIEKRLVPKDGWHYYIPKRNLDNIYPNRKRD